MGWLCGLAVGSWTLGLLLECPHCRFFFFLSFLPLLYPARLEPWLCSVDHIIGYSSHDTQR